MAKKFIPDAAAAKYYGCEKIWRLCVAGKQYPKEENLANIVNTHLDDESKIVMEFKMPWQQVFVRGRYTHIADGVLHRVELLSKKKQISFIGALNKKDVERLEHWRSEKMKNFLCTLLTYLPADHQGKASALQTVWSGYNDLSKHARTKYLTHVIRDYVPLCDEFQKVSPAASVNIVDEIVQKIKEFSGGGQRSIMKNLEEGERQNLLACALEVDQDNGREIDDKKSLFNFLSDISMDMEEADFIEKGDYLLMDENLELEDGDPRKIILKNKSKQIASKFEW